MDELTTEPAPAGGDDLVAALDVIEVLWDLMWLFPRCTV